MPLFRRKHRVQAACLSRAVGAFMGACTKLQLAVPIVALIVTTAVAGQALASYYSCAFCRW